MTRIKTNWNRQLLILLCVLLLFAALIPVTAHAGNYTVSTYTKYNYFVTFASDGTWKGIQTPNHSIVETGAVAYCLQPAKDTPSNSGYTEGMGWSAYDETTRLGIQAILENCNWGYTYDETAMPPDTEVYGYTGSNGDILTIYVPLEYSGYDFDICISAEDNRTPASVLYYGPDNANQQRIVSYTWSIADVVAEASQTVSLESSSAETGTIRIIKTDSVTGQPLEGVWFYLYGPNSDFYSEPTNADGIIEWKVPTGDYRYREAEQPEGYVGDTIRTYTNEDDLVVDCCAGSGTAAVAAINANRRFICFENAPVFYGVAAERIANANEASKHGEKGK